VKDKLIRKEPPKPEVAAASTADDLGPQVSEAPPIVVKPIVTASASSIDQARPLRPATRNDFEIAIFCALTLEADAVEALFDCRWDKDGPPLDRAAGDRNAYSAGAIGLHNVILVHMPGMGKASAAAAAANCRVSFPNIRLAVVVGVCGVAPFEPDGSEIVLGDVIISDGVIQYDLGRRFPERFMRKDTLLDSLGRPTAEIRSILAKLKGGQSRESLQSKLAGYMDILGENSKPETRYPGASRDRLFEATYRHISDGESCDICGCDGPLVSRSRLTQDSPRPIVHFGLIASGDTVMKSGEDRDTAVSQDEVIAFEMEAAGVWDAFPCVVIKGACDYADSHKTKVWQRYAAATAAACTKAFLDHWVPSLPPLSGTRQSRSVSANAHERCHEYEEPGIGLGQLQQPNGPWCK
jgi:nucleoside phosphorylase